jgi:pilus assembly protein CpaB
VRRRRPRSSRPYFAASAVLAAAAAVLIHASLSRAGASPGAEGPAVDVVVAAQSLQRGAVVASSHLRMARLPERYAPPGALESISKAAGRVLLAGLSPGEVVTETRLARVRAGPVASLVPRGLRAFAVPTSLPTGSVVPSDKVDIVATYGGGQPHSEVVVEGVEVLFVLGSSPGPGGDSGLDLDSAAAGADAPTTLILLVSPDQEERLAFARAFASLEVAIEPAE